jgi:NAD(P)-dependent dehydrogenase (short-subunit alcohol dehydrogenase family)
MQVKDAVVFITGANRGIGQAFAEEALKRGARKVYAAARDPNKITLAGVTPVRLDVTDENEVAAAAAACGDVNLLINNAGIAKAGKILGADAMDSVRQHLETNFFGMLRVSAAFAPILAKNGGGGMVNVLSIASWSGSPILNVYAASKAAAWGLTNALRKELSEQKTQVLALHMGFVDTDMTQGFDVPKTSPQSIASQTLDGLEAGLSEVLGDDRTRSVKAGLSADPGVYLLNPPPLLR